MSLGQAVLLVYGLLMLAGGFAGSRAGSRVSLYAGTGSAVALFIALGLTTVDPKLGIEVGIAVSLVLCCAFLSRLFKTGKFMPAGMLLVVSIVALALLSLSIV